MTKGSCNGRPWEDGKANKPFPVGIALPIQLSSPGTVADALEGSRQVAHFR